jgi:HAE1 family hydrophobic/amphiphilic exporter-1
MSLGGLALGVGLLVDDSIVVLESIFRTREQGLDLKEAASQGTRMVAMAVTASTLTTVVVFLPLVFVEGVAGQLIRDQALTVSLSLIASLLVALLVIPTVAALGGRASEGVPLPEGPRGRWRTGLGWLAFGVLALPRLVARAAAWLGARVLVPVRRLFAPVEHAQNALERVYPRILSAALAHRGRVLGGAAVALVAALLAATRLPLDLFPSFAQGEFRFDVRMPEGGALAVTDTTLERVAEVALADRRVKYVYTSAGQTDLAAFSGSTREPNRGQLSVVLVPGAGRAAEDQVAGRLRAALERVPGLSYDYARPQLLTFKSPVEVEVYAYDLDTLRSVAQAVAARLGTVRGIQDLESSMRWGDPEVQITFDRDRLAAYHLDPLRASQLVRNAVQGEAATQFSDLDRKLDVRVRAEQDQRSQVAQLADLEVGRNGVVAVPLAAVADIRVERGPGEVRRIAQQRAAVVTANLKGRDLGSASRDIETALSAMRLPAGVHVGLAGQNREMGESFASIRFALLLAIFLVYLVMASQFESLLHPFVIMFTLPLGVIGVILTLAVTRMPVSVMVLIGMLVLSGIVVKNAIILVDYTNRMRARGKSKTTALIEAGVVRLRPILMTTLTAVLGLVPMALAVGEGSEVGQPLAITIMGGLSFATVLTLIVIPVVYATLDRRP